MLSLWSAACHAFLTRCPPPEGEYCGWELWYFVRGIKKCHASTCFDAGRQKMCILRELLLRWRKCQGQTLFAAEVALQELFTSTCKRCIFLPAHNLGMTFSDAQHKTRVEVFNVRATLNDQNSSEGESIGIFPSYGELKSATQVHALMLVEKAGVVYVNV